MTLWENRSQTLITLLRDSSDSKPDSTSPTSSGSPEFLIKDCRKGFLRGFIQEMTLVVIICRYL